MTLRLLEAEGPVELGSPVVVMDVGWRGPLLALRLQPLGATEHPADGAAVFVHCHIDTDRARDLACLDLWQQESSVVRVALDHEAGRISLWRCNQVRRVRLAIARPAR